MLCRLSLLLLCWALTGLEGLGSDKTPDPSLETTTLADLRKPEKDAPSEAKNAEDSRRGAEPQLPGKHTPLLGKEGGSVPERPAEPLEAEQDNQENIISQLLGDYDKVKTVSSGSDCVCSCVVRPIKRSDCSRITDGDPSSPFYTVETITKGTDCKKCVCMAPPSAVNPCEGEYRFKKLQEASKDDIKLATIMDLLEGSMYGMDLLKLQSVTNKLLSRVDNMEKAFTRNLTERAREKERQKERAKEKEKEKKALQKKKKVVVLERPVPKSGAAANANKKKNYDGPLKKNQQQDGLEQLQSNKTGTEKSVKDKTAPKQPIKDKNSMVIRGVTFYKAAEDSDKEEEEKGRHISRIASDSVDLLIPDHLPPTKPFPTNGPDSSTTLNTKVDFQTKNRPAPTQPPTPHLTTAKQTTTTAKAAPTTIGPVSESTTNIIPTPTKPQTVTLTTTKPTTTKPTTTKPTTQPTTVTITTAKPTTQPTTTKPTTQPTTATMTTAKPTTSTKPIITTTTTTTTTTEPATTTTTTTKPTTGKPTTATTTTRKPTTKSTTTTTTTTTKPTTTTTKPTTKPTTTTTTTKSTTTKLTTSSQQTTTVVLQTTIPAVRLIDASPVEETRPKSRISWTESPADQPKTTKKPTMCKDTVASISEPVQHNTYGLSDGAWMKDARGHGNVIYLTIGQYGNNLQEYRDMDTFKSGQTSNSYKLPYGFTGTGHVVYNGAFYYNRAFSRDVIRYDLRHRYVAAWTTLHDALLEEQVHRTQTEVEFAVDESGLWILYPAVDTEGFHQEVILLVHLNPRDLQPIRSFRTGLRRGRYGNSFLVCGVLYAVNSMEHHYANVTYAFDTHTFTHTVPSLAFTNTHAHTSQLSYCPMDKKLYAWDDGNQMTYDLVFAY